MKDNRREFIKKSVLGAAGLSIAGNALSSNAFMGANDTVNVLSVGVRSRGQALLSTLSELKNVNIHTICDVDSRVLDERTEQVSSRQKKKPKKLKDFRKALENKDIDAVVISSPDFTHTPFAIYAMQAGKHVYVEKPVSHNLNEGFLLVEAQKRYNKLIQIGNQQRSAPTTIQAVKEIREGIIGEPIMAKCWYANNRESIGIGKKVDVPDWLDWDLYQGPAPRREFKDNIVHYNWHWFRHWGTGEVCNNALHELDVCRYAMGVDLPLKVSSKGGRYHHQDDWEFFDTQEAVYTYENQKTIQWEGFSCNSLNQYGRGRGSLIYGTKGSVLLTRNGAEYYDLGGKLINENKEKAYSSTTDLVGAGALEVYHMQNFMDAIRNGSTLNSGVEDINYTNAMCHLANIAQTLDTELEVDQKTGKIVNNAEAMESWGREYEPGWELGL
ncbi:MAG: Gfo/Idh/MocA family oxidoreductase [Cyclobacteriaceae bacterium]|nr:Gfo/Idh/MocA family oxidoreductase [Cyclobacteriaceae bacterium]